MTDIPAGDDDHLLGAVVPSTLGPAPGGEVVSLLDALRARRLRVAALIGDPDMASATMIGGVTELAEQVALAEDELRVQAEQLLLSQQTLDTLADRYREMFLAVPWAMAVTDGHGRLLVHNQAAATLFGDVGGTGARRPIAARFATADRQRVRSLIVKVQARSRAMETQVRLRPIEGRDAGATVSVRVTPFTPDSDGARRLSWELRLVDAAPAVRSAVPGPAEAAVSDAAPFDVDRSRVDQGDVDQGDVAPAAGVQGSTIQAGTVRVDTVSADTVSADIVRADSISADTIRADTIRADTIRADTIRADTIRADTISADTVRADSDRADSDRADSDRADSDQPGAATPGHQARPAPARTSADAVVAEAALVQRMLAAWMASEGRGPVLYEPADIAAAELRRVRQILDSADSCTVTVVDGDGVLQILSSSEPTGLGLDTVQRDLREGPTLDALSRQGSVRSGDIAAHWPGLAGHARSSGIRSVIAAPLPGSRGARGVITLYSRRADAFGFAAETVLPVIAGRLAAAMNYADKITNLERALASRQIIGQACGVIMERHRITAEVAFERLVDRSQRRHVKISRLAELVVETGQDPEEVG